MSGLSELPEDIREAFLCRVKGLMLTRYVGDRRKLEPWRDFLAGLAWIQSYSVPGDIPRNRRRLAKLAEAGIVIEQNRLHWNGVRSFTLPREQLDELAQQALREHEAAGYVLGRMMPTIKGAE